MPSPARRSDEFPSTFPRLAAAAGAIDGAIPPIQSWKFHQNGTFSIITFSVRPDHIDVLLDKDARPITAEHFDVPTYVGGSREKTNRYLLPDRRLIFTVGDTLCITDPQWATCQSVRMTDLILSLQVDETRQRIANSDYSGQVSFFDFALKPLAHTDLESAAVLEFLPDGRLAAGTMRGRASLLDGGGKVLWSKSINRYADPDAVEKPLDRDRGPARPARTEPASRGGTRWPQTCRWVKTRTRRISGRRDTRKRRWKRNAKDRRSERTWLNGRAGERRKRRFCRLKSPNSNMPLTIPESGLPVFPRLRSGACCSLRGRRNRKRPSGPCCASATGRTRSASLVQSTGG